MRNRLNGPGLNQIDSSELVNLRFDLENLRIERGGRALRSPGQRGRSPVSDGQPGSIRGKPGFRLCVPRRRGRDPPGLGRPARVYAGARASPCPFGAILTSWGSDLSDLRSTLDGLDFQYAHNTAINNLSFELNDILDSIGKMGSQYAPGRTWKTFSTRYWIWKTT